MFTRKIPYIGATPQYIRQNVRTGIMRPSTAGMPAPFATVLRRCWQQSMDARGKLADVRAMVRVSTHVWSPFVCLPTNR